MRPWVSADQLSRMDSVANSYENLGGLGSLLRITRALAGNTTLAQKLRFYDHFLAFLKCIGLFLSWRSGFYKSWQEGTEPDIDHFDQRQYDALCSMMQALGVLAEFQLQDPFDKLSIQELESLGNALENGLPSGRLSSTPFQRLLDSIFIMENLLEIYHGNQPKKIRSEVEPWIPLLEDGQLDYEIRLVDTLQHLRSLTLTGKIQSPFPDSFFTGSGERAFRQFTRERFLEIVEDLEGEGHTIQSVLDVGCGYGDYLEALLSQRSDRQLIGLELQHDVATQTANRFAHQSQVSIRKENVLSHSPAKSYDLVLLNYILFYFSGEQQLQLLDHLAKITAPGGCLLLCQYFSGMELLKSDLAKQLQDYSLARKVEMYYGSKIVYANALWNEAVKPFEEAIQWEEWLDKLEKTGWEIAFLGPADRFYYSLFIGIRRKE